MALCVSSYSGGDTRVETNTVRFSFFGKLANCFKLHNFTVNLPIHCARRKKLAEFVFGNVTE